MAFLGLYSKRELNLLMHEQHVADREAFQKTAGVIREQLEKRIAELESKLDNPVPAVTHPIVCPNCKSAHFVVMNKLYSVQANPPEQEHTGYVLICSSCFQLYNSTTEGISKSNKPFEQAAGSSPPLPPPDGEPQHRGPDSDLRLRRARRR